MSDPFAEIIKFTITISAQKRRGRATLHTFSFMPQLGGWYPQAVPSRKQTIAIHRERETRREIHERGGDPTSRGRRGWITGEPKKHDYPPGALGQEPGRSVPLAEGVDVTSAVLVVILDALRDADRREVDLGDIKRVVSQLGSTIKKVSGLPDSSRRHAVPALYQEIVRRCSTLVLSI